MAFAILMLAGPGPRPGALADRANQKTDKWPISKMGAGFDVRSGFGLMATPSCGYAQCHLAIAAWALRRGFSERPARGLNRPRRTIPQPAHAESCGIAIAAMP